MKLILVVCLFLAQDVLGAPLSDDSLKNVLRSLNTKEIELLARVILQEKLNDHVEENGPALEQPNQSMYNRRISSDEEDEPIKERVHDRRISSDEEEEKRDWTEGIFARGVTEGLFDRGVTEGLFDRGVTEGLFDRGVTEGLFDRDVTEGIFGREFTEGLFDRGVTEGYSRELLDDKKPVNKKQKPYRKKAQEDERDMDLSEQDELLTGLGNVLGDIKSLLGDLKEENVEKKDHKVDNEVRQLTRLQEFEEEQKMMDEYNLKFADVKRMVGEFNKPGKKK